jgi:hypothetical protein
MFLSSAEKPPLSLDSPCSMVMAPASIALLIPSAVVAWHTTSLPPLFGNFNSSSYFLNRKSSSGSWLDPVR